MIFTSGKLYKVLYPIRYWPILTTKWGPEILLAGEILLFIKEYPGVYEKRHFFLFKNKIIRIKFDINSRYSENIEYYWKEIQ